MRRIAGEPPQLEPPRGLLVYRGVLAGEEYAVLEWEALLPGAPRALTPAERETLELLLAGRPNREIAAARNVAVRTVANQVASLVQKLGVRSRSELFSRIAAVAAHEDPP
jgi:DNA-binding CsgD family transcriptional regulator